MSEGHIVGYVPFFNHLTKITEEIAIYENELHSTDEEDELMDFIPENYYEAVIPLCG